MNARPNADGIKAAGWLAALLCATCFCLSMPGPAAESLAIADASHAWCVLAVTIDRPEAPLPLGLALPPVYRPTVVPLTLHAEGSAFFLFGQRILTYIRPLGGHAPPPSSCRLIA